MAKETGLGMAVAIDDSGGSARTISNDITSCDFAIPRSVQDVTGLDKSANERLLLLADFSITLNGVFNDASNMSHDVFKTVSSTSVARTTTLTISGQSLATESFFTDYALSRAATGELTFTTNGVLQSGSVPTWA
tara:strand:+ start:614 stop:1018 length:405 start_codon:yes stop_codon:yes gene_type:complete